MTAHFTTIMSLGDGELDIDMDNKTGFLEFDVSLDYDTSSRCFHLTKDEMIQLRDYLISLNL